MRICISILLLIQGFFLLPELFEFFGEKGIIQAELNEYLGLAWLPTVATFTAYVGKIGFSHNDAVLGLFLIYLGSLTALLLGWHTRTAAVFSWFLHFTFMNTATVANYGVDQFTHFVLFYFTWMPISKSFSVDKVSGGVSSEIGSDVTLSLRLIQLHLCVVYFVAGFGKAKGVMWWNGEAIWRALMLPEYNQFDFSWLATVPILAIMITWASIGIEILYPVFIWPKRTRRWWVIAILGLHLGIGFFQGLYLFAAVMIILTGTAFGISADLNGKQYQTG